MLTALNKRGERTAGWKADKKSSYYCPACSEKLLVKQGDMKLHHFAHVAETKCAYGRGETDKHREMKFFLCKKFAESGLYKEIIPEHRIGERIADIYLVNRINKRISVECQVPPLDIAEFRKRTAFYSYKGIYTVWIFSGSKMLEDCIMKLSRAKGARLNYLSSETERKCHRWYYGRIYCMCRDSVYAVHFHRIEKWVPSACDECIKNMICGFRPRTKCSRYKAGYFRVPKALREISVYPVSGVRLLCADRKDKLRIARFGDPFWWKA